MKIKYKEYEISQSDYNFHVWICKDGKMVMHISATQKFTEEELKSFVDFWLED